MFINWAAYCIYSDYLILLNNFSLHLFTIKQYFMKVSFRKLIQPLNLYGSEPHKIIVILLRCRDYTYKDVILLYSILQWNIFSLIVTLSYFQLLTCHGHSCLVLQNVLIFVYKHQEMYACFSLPIIPTFVWFFQYPWAYLVLNINIDALECVK